MKARRFLSVALPASLLAACLLTVLPPVASAPAQEELKQLAPDALAPHGRPAARFDHDAHNEKAKLDDCGRCHHGTTKEGRLDPGAPSSEGTPCADCHAVKGGKGTPLQRAYHRQCMGCHKDRGAGPTACGGCHAGR